MDYRKGDIFVHHDKGTIAIITKIYGDKYDFKYSHPDDRAGKASDCWTEVKGKPTEDITFAVDKGLVILYRPHRTLFDDKLFEAD